MCGIAGFVGRAPDGLLPAMMRSLRHRGPDEEGQHVELQPEPAIGLAMTRLAIIDLATGQQPMRNAPGSAWVVFNGEIYNFRELRAQLEGRGRTFRTQSDTEVLLAAWEVFGEACVEHLEGMFAFALWDRERRRLLLARDRLGKKPLYYWQRPGLFLFASEIKALLAHAAVARDVDWTAFHHYLSFGYTPSDRSIFAEIAKLPAGHLAVLAGGTLKVSRYWALPSGLQATTQAVAPGEAAALVRHEVREAVRRRLESDVPLGVFLSGGIDSSAVVASMREITSQRIATFSVGFGGAAPSFDERPAARVIARRFETDHHEEILTPDVGALLPALVHHFDEPFADSSAVATFVVAQATARHVKVALSGIGGDEAFAGYPRYLGLRLSELYARLPRRLRGLPARTLLPLLRESDGSRSWGSWIRRFLIGAEQPLPDRYLGWTRFFGERDLSALATPGLRALWSPAVEEAQRAAFADYGHDDPLDGAFRIDLSTYLTDDLLAMADRMSMAHSLELRAPFCDPRVIEQSLRIAPAVKLPGATLKGLLKTAFRDVLPPEILRRRKQGFMIPLARWLRTDLRPALDDLLAPDVVRARGLFDPGAVEALKREHLSGQRGHADRLWTLMMAELWMRHHLDAREPWRLPAPAAEIRPRRAAAAPRLNVLAVADVSPVVVLGGGERVLGEQISRLAARGHQVHVVSRMPAEGGPLATVHGGVPVRHFGADRRSLARFIRASVLQARRAVIDEVERHGADVLHCHQPLAALGALSSPPGRRLPSLYTFHSPAPLEYRLRQGAGLLHRRGAVGTAGAALLWVVERAALMRATRIHVLSDYSASLLRQLYRIDPARIVKIPGGVDTDRFRPAADRAQARAALGLPGGRPLLFTLRNLEPRMGLGNLLLAMDRVRRRAPEVLLLIGGAGSLRPALEREVEALGLGEHVRFLGFVAEGDLPRHYAAADAFVLPTRELEGFGLVTLEALACGTPVLGTPVGAIPEILAPLAPSLLFADASARAMAEGIERFLDACRRDASELARLRAQSRRHVETHYGWSGAIDGLEAALRTLAEREGGLMPAAACPACASSTEPGLRYRGRRYRECPRCRTAVAPVLPEAAELRRFYETEYPACFAPQHAAAPRLDLFDDLLRRLTAIRRGRLLDLGCGGGQLLAAALRHGWRGLGGDVSSEACAAAGKISGAAVLQTESGQLPLRAASVDAVTLINVLDHLRDPARTLTEVHRVLAPGGALALRVPNGTFHRAASRTLARLGPLGRWRGLAEYPVLHLFSFTADGLATLVAAAGFEVLEVRNSPPVSTGPADARSGRLSPGLRACVAGGARGIERLSGGRWLVAPSIELYARRRPDVARP
jgi:asparagine synthase (glutamine-hydrolysing)